MAPMNFADQPMSLVRALRRRGVDAHHLQYTSNGQHALGYALDRVALMRAGDFRVQFDALRNALAEGFDIYHFWQRSLLFGPNLDGLTGLDLPLIKSHGGRIFHRFTGWDLRLPSADRLVNPHSPFHHGFTAPVDEDVQRRYIDMLRQHVDLFLVQDPEMRQFMPEARILPRGLALDQRDYVGVQPTARPLVVHAPSNAEVKGSRFVIRALEELSAEGLHFDFQLLDRVPHKEAREWYRRADIIVDQIMIGATGVLTLEAWALGKPCITYLREDLFEPFYGTRDLPVANATPDTIKSVLTRLIKDYEWREHLSRRGRETAVGFHDIEKVAEQYLEICGEQSRHAVQMNRAVADLDFFGTNLITRAQPATRGNAPEGRAEAFGRLELRRAGVGQLNLRGRVEQGLHNSLARLFLVWLRAQKRLLLGNSAPQDSPRLARAINAQTQVCRAILAAETRAFANLSRWRRALSARLTGRG